MLFCPDCNNSLDISKSKPIAANVDTATPDTVSSSTAEPPKKEQESEGQGAYHMCYNCLYHEPIKKKTLILSKTHEKNVNVYEDYDMFSDYKNANILPRTTLYTCQNKDCKTHSNAKAKEAVFFRSNLYNNKTIMACIVCDHIWSV